MKTFIDAPTFYSTSFGDQKEARFPDITVCFKPKDNHPIPLKLEKLSALNRSLEEFIPSILEEPELYDELTFSDKWDLFNYFYIRLFEFDYKLENTGFRMGIKYPEFDEFADTSLILRRHPIFGQCRTMRYHERFRPQGLYYMYTRT